LQVGVKFDWGSIQMEESGEVAPGQPVYIFPSASSISILQDNVVKIYLDSK
jgi:hypothetical protein